MAAAGSKREREPSDDQPAEEVAGKEVKEFDPDDAQAGLKQKGPPIQIPEEPAAALFSETVAGAAVEDGPGPAKKARVETEGEESAEPGSGQPAPSLAPAFASDAPQSDSEPAQPAAQSAQPAAVSDPPRKIGYTTFLSAQAALDYFAKITGSVRLNQDLNEYEQVMALDLLRIGHPAAARKLAPGVKAIQVKAVEAPDATTTCFHLIRPDGSAEDFSTRKCIAALFPHFGAMKAKVSSGTVGRWGGRSQRGAQRGNAPGRGRGDRGGRGNRGGRNRGRRGRS